MLSKEEILRVENLTKYYTLGYIFTKKVIGAENVTFDLKRGEILSIVGESGSGKSTVANMILGLIKPTSGKILLDGKDLLMFNKKDYWKSVQGVFQDPYSTFNPFYTVDKPLIDTFYLLESTSENRKFSKNEREKIIRESLKTVGIIPDEILGRYPHQLSGGQLQRLLIARSLIICPEVLLADEPTSMIDASTRLAILNELLELKEARGLSMLFITHDVGQAYYLSDRTIVMEKGKIVEIGPAEEVFFQPKCEYTKRLVASVPKLHEVWNI